MAEFLQRNPATGLVYTDYQVIDEQGTIIGYHHAPPVEDLYVRSIAGACFLYRRKVYETTGEYNTQATYFEDHEYWFRVRKNFTMERMQKALYFYRKHKDNLSVFVQNHPQRSAITERLLEMKSRYVTPSQKHYLYAVRSYELRDLAGARLLTIKSLLRNPCHGRAWRLLAYLTLGYPQQKLLKRIKKMMWRSAS